MTFIADASKTRYRTMSMSRTASAPNTSSSGSRDERRQDVQSRSGSTVTYAKMYAVALGHHLRIRDKSPHESTGSTRVRFATLPL